MTETHLFSRHGALSAEHSVTGSKILKNIVSPLFQTVNSNTVEANRLILNLTTHTLFSFKN